MDYLELLKDKKLTLIVSLPSNDLRLAEAAVMSGADAIKVHINVEHRASKNCFKSLKEELNVLREIMKLCKSNNLPLGIVAGGSDNIPMEEIDGIIEEGFAFISLYDKHMNPSVLTKDIYKMVAIDYEYRLEWIKACDSLPIDVLECSIMEPSTYGRPLTVRELLQYQSIRHSTIKPIVIPTQRKITPEQAGILQEMGLNAIMVGAIVTGKDEDSLYNSVCEFRKAIDGFNS